jgi:hypothetical protein
VGDLHSTVLAHGSHHRNVEGVDGIADRLAEARDDPVKREDFRDMFGRVADKCTGCEAFSS